MDTLPFETLERIFRLACTDGGPTGNALSLVSKDVRAVARTTRFHSVALAASPRRLQAFLALYQREHDPARGEKSRIRHLYVTFPRVEPWGFYDTERPWARSRSLSPPRRPESPRNNPAQDGGERGLADPVAEASTLGNGPQAAIHIYTNKPLPPLPAQAPFRGRGTVDPRRRPRPVERNSDTTALPEYLNAAQMLFRLITPDLVTLVVQCGFTFGGSLCLPIIDRPFPHLREATIVGVRDPRKLLTDEASAHIAPLFPALTHLSIVPLGPGNDGVLVPFWSTHGPRVSHLSVSNAESCLEEIASAVGVWVKPTEPLHWHAAVGPPGPPPPVSPPPPPVLEAAYPSVQHLLVRPGPGPLDAWCGNPWRYYDKQREQLRQVVCDCQGVGVEAMEVDPPRDNKYSSYCDAARSSWLERIDDNGDRAGRWGDIMVMVFDPKPEPSAVTSAVGQGRFWSTLLESIS